MKTKNTKIEKRARRHTKIRSKLSGTAARPRLSVFKSTRYMYAQLIDDDASKTLIGFFSKTLKSGTPRERAIASGKKIAELAKAKGITAVVFDRGGFLYQGSIKSFADAAREGGLQF